MVVRWTEFAENKLKEIFDYYFDVAGYNVAGKIVTKIKRSADSLGTMPFIAPIEENLEKSKFIHRSLVVNRTYKVVYFIDEEFECVVIATIWDCRRDPSKLQEERTGDNISPVQSP